MEVFTDEWGRACCREINGRPAYRTAAAEWEGAVVLVMERDPALGVEEERALWLDLHHGECRGTRPAAPDDLERAAYVLRAVPAVWRHVLDGELDPIAAVMSGRLRLARGSLFSLARFTAAAREMVAAAAAVEASFPPARL